MSCNENERRLGEYLTGALAGRERHAVRRHLEGCPACRAEIDELRRLEAVLPQCPEPRRRRTLVAAGIVAAAGIVVMTLVHGGWEGDEAGPIVRSGVVALGDGTLRSGDAVPLGCRLRVQRDAVVAATDGVELRLARGSVAELTSASGVMLRRGRIDCAMRGASGPWTVATPVMELRARDAEFNVEVEHEDVKSQGKVTAVAAIATVAVIAGVVVMSRDGDGEVELESGQTREVRDEPAVPDDVTTVARRHETPPDSTGEQLVAWRQRAEELEARLRELERQHERELGDLKARHEARVKKLVEDQAAEKDGAKTKVKVSGGLAGVADLLGLEPARQEALQQAYDDIMGRIHELEAEHATVETSEDGRTTTIEVPKFEKDGELVRQDWKNRLSSILSQPERERYERNSLEKSIFRHPVFGTATRSIEITRLDDKLQVADTVKAKGHKWSTRSDVDGDDRQVMLDGFRHFLDKARR